MNTLENFKNWLASVMETVFLLAITALLAAGTIMVIRSLIGLSKK